jgi:hypothetical protein
MYHLATQIKAVTQYRLAPSENQMFTFTEEELKAQPEEIKLLAKENPRLISKKLVSAMVNDGNIKEKFRVLMSRKYKMDLKLIGPGAFYCMLEKCTAKEIEDISLIGHLRAYDGPSDLLKRGQDKTIKSVRDFLDCLDKLDIDMDTLVMYYLDLKKLGYEEVSIKELKTLIIGLSMSNNALSKAYELGYEFRGFDDEEEISDLVRKLMCNKKSR